MQPTTHLYEQVAERLSTAIKTGALRPGDRLPSVRRLSERERVSISTVLQAYMHLEDAGLIETRPQSGHYVRVLAPRALPEPQVVRPTTLPMPVRMGTLIKRVYSTLRDPSIVPLGSSTPDASLLPAQRLHAMMASNARRHPAAAIQYDVPPGSLALRQQLAKRALEWGCVMSPDDFIITVGASEAIHVALMTVARRGDTIAIESPAYYGTLQSIEALELKALEIPAHPRHGMDLDVLEEALRQTKVAAVLSVSNFSNPLGSLMPEENKQRLVAMLARHDVPLIEDDIYGDLHFGPTRPRISRAYDSEGRVLSCGSFSKTLAPGYRVGWLAPGRYREKAEVLKFAQSVATPSLPQLAIAEFLSSGGYERHLRQLRRAVHSQMQCIAAAVAEHFPSGTGVSRPEGGAVLWVELPRGVDALELHRRALELGISIAPGVIFSARERFRNCFRLTCAHPYDARIAGALQTVGRLANTLARREA